ncbi:MAG TPA: RodZ domain-containing protein [Bryobacteraceae bacterium]|nr:RodZ domain-containing protein [Bryobacteraceae bacterium]
MQSVGQRLRKARLELGRSLEDVSANTRIALKNLQAIEADEVEKLGSPFFYRSFVRQFADQLNLHDSEFASDVQAASNILPEPLIPGQGDGPFPAVNALPVRRPRSFKWVSSLASLIVMMFACSAVYAVWQNSRSNLHTSIHSFWSSVAAPDAPAHRSIRPAQVRTVSAPVAQAPEATWEPTMGEADGAYRIELSAVEPTWLSINADGQQTFSGILAATDTKVLEARENVRIRTGNAGGVNVTLNGKALGAIGPRGQIRTVVFTKNAYEVLPPEPRLSLTQFSPSGE